MELINRETRPSGPNKLTTRAGAYSVFATLLVLGVAVVVNLILAALPQGWSKLDVTGAGMYSLSDQTRQLSESLREEVVLHWVVEPGAEDRAVETLLSRYEDLSPLIVTRRVDPAQHPGFAGLYTAASLPGNSVIVQMGQRHKVVDYADIYAYDLSKFYETGEYQVYFDGEAALTGAIASVASEAVPKLYLLTGHGEPDAVSHITDRLRRDNLEVAVYNLVGGAAVPEDADLLMIYNPSSDFAAPEVDMLIDYMARGGRMLLVTDPARRNLPNLDYLAAYYALEPAGGMVLEGSPAHYAWGRTDYLFPELRAHAVTNALRNRGYRVLLPGSGGFRQDPDARASLEITPLLVTSADSFAMIPDSRMENPERRAEDPAGPFLTGVLVKERVGAVQGELIWFPCGEMLTRDTVEMSAGANLDLFCNAAAYLAGNETVISVRSKVMTPERLQVTASAGNLLAFCLVGVVPAAYMLPGVIVTVRRRRMR